MLSGALSNAGTDIDLIAAARTVRCPDTSLDSAMENGAAEAIPHILDRMGYRWSCALDDAPNRTFPHASRTIMALFSRSDIAAQRTRLRDAWAEARETYRVEAWADSVLDTALLGPNMNYDDVLSYHHTMMAQRNLTRHSQSVFPFDRTALMFLAPVVAYRVSDIDALANQAIQESKKEVQTAEQFERSMTSRDIVNACIMADIETSEPLFKNETMAALLNTLRPDAHISHIERLLSLKDMYSELSDNILARILTAQKQNREDTVRIVEFDEVMSGDPAEQAEAILGMHEAYGRDQDKILRELVATATAGDRHAETVLTHIVEQGDGGIRRKIVHALSKAELGGV